LAVPVLARERAAHRQHEVRGLVEEAAEGADALMRDEVEVPARVDAALAVMSVEGALVAVFRGEPPERAQVVADALRRDRRVLPTLVRICLAGDERCGAETRLANLPEVLLAPRVVVELHALQALVLLRLGH